MTVCHPWVGQETVRESYARCDDLIAAFRSGQLGLQRGCDLEQSLELQVTGVLNGIRESVSKVRPAPPQRSPPSLLSHS